MALGVLLMRPSGSERSDHLRPSASHTWRTERGSRSWRELTRGSSAVRPSRWIVSSVTFPSSSCYVSKRQPCSISHFRDAAISINLLHLTKWLPMLRAPISDIYQSRLINLKTAKTLGLETPGRFSHKLVVCLPKSRGDLPCKGGWAGGLSFL